MSVSPDPSPDTPALEITGLAVTFSHPRPAVRNISIHVDRGQILALVGESGSGKSITAKAAIGLLPDTAHATGSVRIGGTEILGVPEKDLNALRGRRVAMVFQEPQSALNPVRSVGWLLSEALQAHQKLSRAARKTRAIELLTLVELPDPELRYDYYPHQLSGGQKQRVVIALALANDPLLLLADEPTTALDVTVQAEILSLLRRLRDRINAGILLITHNLAVVADIADRVVVLQLGEVVERADVDELFAHPEHPYTRSLLAAIPRLPDPASTPEDDALLEPSDVAIDVRDLTVVYGDRRREHRALDGVSVTVGRGEVVGVVGESGSGKTTLGRVIAGLVPAQTGVVTVDGQAVTGLRGKAAREFGKKIALIPQDPVASLDPLFTVGAAISEPLDIHRVGTRSERRDRVAELLDAVQLPGSFATRRPHELSGGQRQRVALARALALNPTVLIADEPTSALDVSIQANVLELFKNLQRELGFSAVFISHDLAVVEQVADRVAVLQSGKLIEFGQATTVLTRPSEEYTQRLVRAVPVPDPAIQRQRRAIA